MTTHESELLTPDEIKELTGAAKRGEQLEWLKMNHIPHMVNRAGRPVVGRHCARTLLCGINLKTLAQPSGGWELPVGKIA